MNWLIGILFSALFGGGVYLYVAENYDVAHSVAIACGLATFVLVYAGYNWWSVENDPIIRNSQHFSNKQANFRKRRPK